MSENKEETTTMQCVYHEAYGAVDQVLKLGSLPVPKPKPNQVLVKIACASINPVDWKIVVGAVAKVFPKQFPHICGFDCSGTVVAVGSEVQEKKSFAVGDKVYSDTFNTPEGATFAEYAAIDDFRLAKMPKNLGFAEAASIPLAVLTSLQALQALPVQKDSKVLVLGGGGGCGSFGVMLAKAEGAFVATTCGPSNVERMKQMGADVIVDYSTSKWGEVLQGKDYDIVYDTIGEQGSYETAVKVLKKGGLFVEIASRGEAIQDYPRKFILTDTSQGTKSLDYVTSLVEKNLLKSHVEKVYKFTLDQVVEMFKHSMSGRAKGKLVLLIDENAK